MLEKRVYKFDEIADYLGTRSNQGIRRKLTSNGIQFQEEGRGRMKTFTITDIADPFKVLRPQTRASSDTFSARPSAETPRSRGRASALSYAASDRSAFRLPYCNSIRAAYSSSRRYLPPEYRWMRRSASSTAGEQW